jgi:hypothetical protein
MPCFMGFACLLQQIMGSLHTLEARPTPVERASLDAVSVQELEAAVASLTTPDACRWGVALYGCVFARVRCHCAWGGSLRPQHC